MAETINDLHAWSTILFKLRDTNGDITQVLTMASDSLESIAQALESMEGKED